MDFPGDSSTIEADIYEPCNFASNWAYYELASSTTELENMKSVMPAPSKALVQASAGLAFSSSFFHGSQTNLGNKLDNHMIKVLSFVLYQTHLQAAQVDDPVLMELKDQGRRYMTGVEMAESMTEMFRTKPISDWDQHVDDMDVPSYELTLTAFILTNFHQFELPNWLIDEVENSLRGSLMKNVSQQENLFIDQSLKTQISKLPKKSGNQKIQNFFAAVLKLFESALYQGELEIPWYVNGGSKLAPAIYKIMKGNLFDLILKLEVLDIMDGYVEKNFIDLVDEMTDYRTTNVLRKEDVCQVVTSGGVNGRRVLYPGEEYCKIDGHGHSTWHSLSAVGLFELFKYVDDYLWEKKFDS